MSQKRSSLHSVDIRPHKGEAGKKSNTNLKLGDSKFKEHVIRSLYEAFQDNFDLALIASVAHTCQWDIHKATEALVILSGRKNNKKKKSSKNDHKDGGTKSKAKSLPGTLKSEKSPEGKGMGLNNPTHYSTNSLSSGQIWQRHYKSKPQSPGLLTMIPPHSKEIIKLKKSDSGRSTPKSGHSADIKKASAIVTKIQKLVQNGVKVMILMRGVPGSGKTHLAQVLVGLVTGNELSQHIFSTDDYFILLGRGSYAYDFNQLPQAHNWNQKRVSEALKRGINPVVVDNTNTQAWEMQPYVVMAVEHGYLVEVLEPVTDWRFKEAELAKKNVHSVPREKIRQMLERYEHGWTGDKLLKLFGLKFKHAGVSQVTQEKRLPVNTVLAQHRQHAVIDTPEKPKRKKNGAKKKNRHQVAGLEVTEDKEKQLEELNKLFAEYGKTMDPISKQKVLESGVPISEVVSRMRKLQGNILPLPKANVPPAIPETQQPAYYDKNVIKPVPKYGVPRRDSLSESAEPDTMSSSNASETSECETDTEAEPQKWKEIRRYFEYGEPGRFVDGEDLWEDCDDDEEGRKQSEGLARGILSKYPLSSSQRNDDEEGQEQSEGPARGILSKFPLSSSQWNDDEEGREQSEGTTRGILSKYPLTSSQEELSLIDFGTNTTTGTFSQDDLSLLNFDGSESPNARASSSSSEEQETQMLTLQESLREALMGNLEKVTDTVTEKKERNESEPPVAKPSEVELSDSLLKTIGKRFEAVEDPPKIIEPKEAVSINESLLEILVKKYSQEEPVEEMSRPNIENCKKSPDLEEVPLPSIPPKSEIPSDWGSSKRDKFEDIVCSWEHPTSVSSGNDSSPKEARSKNSLLGAIKKTGIQRDKSPEELLRSVDLSWSSIPFTSSWDDVSRKPPEKDAQLLPKPQRNLVQKAESSTNTSHGDFDLWKREEDGIVKLTPRNRNINENYKEPGPATHMPEILMLDKSSMTLDAEEIESLEKDSAVENLSGMFPGIPREHLADMLDKCKGNILWAIEVLLESPQNLDEFVEGPSSEQNPPTYNEAKAMSEAEFASLQNVITDGKKTIKRKKDKKGTSSELSQLLKKKIENSIHINEELYQDRTLFLKKLRHGEIEFGDGPIETAPEPASEDLGAPAKEEGEESEGEEEEMIPMKIDEEFFKILAKHFGPSDANTIEKQASFLPVINVPLSLAQQIYDCWLENVNQQLEELQNSYDKSMKEDELLATALQEQEFEYRQPDLREIMDMELAMLLYKQDQAQLHENTRETIATKLSKKLLFEAYPKMDKKMLLDLFESEGRSFQKTVEILSARENESSITVIAPEFLAAHGNKLLEQAKSEKLKKNVDSVKKPILVVKPKTRKKDTPGKSTLLVNPAEYRQKTALLHQRRNECARFAQEAFRKKSYAVASYFSHLMSLYKEKLREMSKEPFPSTLFDDKGSKLDTQVDLHFLYVPEALQIADLFLDHHINELRKKNTDNPINLYLITGRGQHSFKGKSKIKPVIEKRLEQRKLSFWESNPGMLNVVIMKNDLLSCEL